MNSPLSSETHSNRLTAPQWIYQTLRHRILRGELAPGQALRQQHLAREFGLSPIPVREALRMLEADRFVTINANRGAVVRSVSLSDARDIVDIRLALEPLAIGMAVPNMSRQDVNAASDLLAAYAGVDDTVEWSTLNRQFHFSLYERCGSPRLLQMIDSLFDEILRYAHVNISNQQGNEQPHREHTRILNACRNGNAQQASKHLHAHIERSRRSLNEVLKLLHNPNNTRCSSQ